MTNSDAEPYPFAPAARLHRWVYWLALALLGVAWVAFLSLRYSPEYVSRELFHDLGNVYDYQSFPERKLTASDRPFHFKQDLQEAVVKRRRASPDCWGVEGRWSRASHPPKCGYNAAQLNRRFQDVAALGDIVRQVSQTGSPPGSSLDRPTSYLAPLAVLSKAAVLLEVAMNDIADLDFGKESAESEQKFLTKVFLPTPVFERIRGGHKQLVLGRKGAGKTAVCLTVYEHLRQQELNVSLITPRDLSKFKISLLEKGSLNTAESSLLAWKYVFLAELGEYALQVAEEKYGGSYLSWPEPFKGIRSFMAENMAKHANWMDRTFKVVRAIKKIGVIHIEAEVDRNSAQEEVEGFADRLDEVPAMIAEALQSLNEPIYLLVDQVDEVWEPSRESQALVVGLLRAGKELHEQLGSVHVITFLRSDIFDALQFHDSDKFHSSEERILWNEKDLKSLVALRARTSTQISGKRGATDQIWQRFFPASVDDRDSFEYLLQYTLMRPRDLIQLCNLCRDKAQNHRHSKIEAADIQEALPQFSKWKLRDLRDEYVVQYPFLERVFLGVFQYSAVRMTRDEIGERFDPVKEHLLKEFDRFYFEPITNLLQILYYTGFLGAVKDGRVLYSSAGDDVIISSIEEFEIHPAFRLALDVRRAQLSPGRAPRSTGTVVADAETNVGHRDSNIQIGGVANVSIVVGRSERELGQIISRFKGQQVPGSIFNLEGSLQLPAFGSVQPEVYIPDADVRLDFLASGPQAWAVEVKYRTLQSSDLHEAASHALAAGAKAWIVSHNPIPEQTRVVARNLGIMLTGPEELTELSELVQR